MCAVGYLSVGLKVLSRTAPVMTFFAAGDDIAHLDADKGGTFAGLDMLKICNAPNLSVYFNGNAFSEIAS